MRNGFIDGDSKICPFAGLLASYQPQNGSADSSVSTHRSMRLAAVLT